MPALVSHCEIERMGEKLDNIRVECGAVSSDLYVGRNPTAAEYFPNDIIFGNLNPAIIQSGTPEEVYQASKEVVERGKALANGFIFAPGCELPPRAPVENLRAMTRAVEDFGWY